MTISGLYINGEWQSTNSEFAVNNPANGEQIGRVSDGDSSHANDAIEAASEAFKTWSITTTYERELAQLMTREQGKPLKAASNEVQYAADFLRWFAEEAVRNYGETIPSARADQRFIVRHEPVGIVAAITPWNYPISMITRKLAPALAAGCTVVLKPAESTPLCAIEVFKILIEAGVPSGVINLRMSMELGGHAPFIVFDDADPRHAAKGASLVKFLNTGQACISPNRIFVQRSILEPFIETFKLRIQKLKAGDGMRAENSIGPLVNQAAVDKVSNQVIDATNKGATLEIGGHPLNDGELAKGHFYAPTLLSDVSEEMLIYRQETFGPVAAVVAFDDDKEVIARANDTHYGLAAYIYSQNLSRAMHTFEALDFGIVGINDINPTSAAAPFGGMKESGLGREGARAGLAEYLETKLGGFSI